MIVLSHYQAQPLLNAREEGRGSLSISLDLNLSQDDVTLDADGVSFPDGSRLAWPHIEEIAGEENKCYQVRDGDIEAILIYSETTHWVRSLYPTQNAPTMLVAGMPMHRIKDTDPHRDTLAKIRAIHPSGVVLDTATGLGYTAIEAAGLPDVQQVVTVEIDPAGLEIARHNPWSQDLFHNPKIEQIVGDVFDVVEEVQDAAFSVIIHDPPTFSLAGDLYSKDFYAELYRIIRPKGRVFHYIGDPGSASQQKVTRGVVERLQQVGFRKVTHKPFAFGVAAYK